ncbi:unnamed protein product [Amoebophrya sp. A25]|nr:unnamed protein product [Amoebophrya sp. A25]|eukprot:GSA25T00005530001.1
MLSRPASPSDEVKSAYFSLSWTCFVGETAVIFAGGCFCYTYPPWTLILLFSALCLLEALFLRTRGPFFEDIPIETDVLVNGQHGAQEEDAFQDEVLCSGSRQAVRKGSSGSGTTISADINAPGLSRRVAGVLELSEIRNGKKANPKSGVDQKNAVGAPALLEIPGLVSAAHQHDTKDAMNAGPNANEEEDFVDLSKGSSSNYMRRREPPNAISTKKILRDDDEDVHLFTSSTLLGSRSPGATSTTRTGGGSSSKNLTTTSAAGVSATTSTTSFSTSNSTCSEGSLTPLSFGKSVLSFFLMHDDELQDFSMQQSETPTGSSWRKRHHAAFYARFLFHLERQAKSSGIVLGGCLLPLLFGAPASEAVVGVTGIASATGGGLFPPPTTSWIINFISLFSTVSTTGTSDSPYDHQNHKMLDSSSLSGATTSLGNAGAVLLNLGTGGIALAEDGGDEQLFTTPTLRTTAATVVDDVVHRGAPIPKHTTLRAAYVVTTACSIVAAVFLLLYYCVVVFSASSSTSSNKMTMLTSTGTRRQPGISISSNSAAASRGALTATIFSVFLSMVAFALLEFVFQLKPPAPLTNAELCFGVPLVFLLSMYAVIVVLRKSFTLGEATLLSQCNVLLSYMFYLVIVQQRIRLSKLRSVILLGLFGAVFIAGHIFCLHFFCCKQRRRRSSGTFSWLSGPPRASSSSSTFSGSHEDHRTKTDAGTPTDDETTTSTNIVPAPRTPSTRTEAPTSSCFTASLLFYPTTLAAVLLLFEAISVWIRENSILWILKYVTHHSATPLRFIAYFASVLAGGLLFGLPLVRKISARRIVTRKYFHFLAIVMFVPSILVHIRFSSLAFAVAFAVLLLIEAFRSAGVPPVAHYVTEFISPYIDTRDAGTVILTHMYLLLGCAVPVWYAFFVHGGIFQARSLLIALSGLTCTGVGDSFASIVGTSCGKHRWPGGLKKTIEGSLGFFVSAFAFQAIMLYILGFHNLSTESWLRLALADFLVAILEACTDQIDNLILPLYHCALLQFV